MKTSVMAIALLAGLAASCGGPKVQEWVETTASSQWQEKSPAQVKVAKASDSQADATVSTAQAAQTVDGFGGCFNELGWTSLSMLRDSDKAAVLDELFTPGKGANLNLCRMPVGSNDFSRDYYSYDETEGDFDMKYFSIANDRETLIPFIHEALRRNPDIKIWASPWCPPAWMKDNKHYACSMLRTNFFKDAKETGITPEQTRKEGDDMFIMDSLHLQAYALYFSKFVQDYADEGIKIFMVAPQNEFNSCQPYPSCLWRAKLIATFIGKYLGPEMSKIGVDVMFGTMERPSTAMVDTVLQDPLCQKYVSAAGFQWAGKLALPYTQKNYPELKLYATEQECGDGRNNWPACLHAWGLMKHYFRYGVNAYDYWNISLEENKPSRWGWRQNSLVTVNPADSSYKFTYEYYLLKHASRYVRQGAKYLPVSGGYDDMMAFRNPDGSVVLILHNPGPDDPEKDMYDFTAFSAKADSSGLSNPLGKSAAVEEAAAASGKSSDTKVIRVDGVDVTVTLAPGSFNTIVLRP